ncbi:MAG TPA: sugar ABC transporter ATP-binding protein [Victivallales bacterium]|nr:sugar ABC transporter ATP-binding protein [Victivallales bacterium]
MSDIILEMKDIVKEFPGVKALDGVNIKLIKGEMLALVGENGAGKSTLMKVLSGVYTDYEGDILLRNKKCTFKGTKDAEKAGIAIIHQELNLVNELSVMENIFLGSEPRTMKILTDYKTMTDKTNKILKSLNLDIECTQIVKELSVGKQQMVEIAKAISKNADILIFDEPTSALSDKEAIALFEIIDKLQKSGVSIIYISHRMDEIFTMPDKISILRDGVSIGTWDREKLDLDTLIKHMVGREISQIYPTIKNKPGEVVLKVENFNVDHPLLSGEKIVKDINFELRKGEILGISGLMGSGRSELVEGIFGAFSKDTQGSITLFGEKVKIRNPRDAIDYGMALVTEDRKTLGLVLPHSVRQNITLSILKKLKKLFVINEKAETELVDEYIKSLRIKTPNPDFIVNNLSGGNQQKVILAKCLATKPKILILDEPTRGIDIGSKSEIYNIIKDLSESGISIIMVSSELPEILKLSNRIMVMRDGKSRAVIDAKDADQGTIMYHATAV